MRLHFVTPYGEERSSRILSVRTPSEPSLLPDLRMLPLFRRFPILIPVFSVSFLRSLPFSMFTPVLSVRYAFLSLRLSPRPAFSFRLLIPPSHPPSLSLLSSHTPLRCSHTPLRLSFAVSSLTSSSAPQHRRLFVPLVPRSAFFQLRFLYRRFLSCLFSFSCDFPCT